MTARCKVPFALICLPLALRGCTLNDPNQNEKMRWGMAQAHADIVIKSAGADPRQYAQEVFWREHYDSTSRVVHVDELYDFLKTTPGPGPERFVIAYDKDTRKTYLRTDLRSNENLDHLPTPAGSLH